MNTLHRVALLAAFGTLPGIPIVSPVAASAHCAVVATPAATPSTDEAVPASPSAHRADRSPEQLYIDMMIPHHVGIVALAEAALPSLHDDRLRDMATAIVATQEAEIAELQAMRADRFGSPDPMPMDEDMLAALHDLMPEEDSGEHAMDPTAPDMAIQMDAAALIASYCQAVNPDLAFARLTLAHHQMAVDSSQRLRESTQDEELRGLAERVITAQEAEIAVLRHVLDESAVATPMP